MKYIFLIAIIVAHLPFFQASATSYGAPIKYHSIPTFVNNALEKDEVLVVVRGRLETKVHKTYEYTGDYTRPFTLHVEEVLKGSNIPSEISTYIWVADHYSMITESSLLENENNDVIMFFARDKNNKYRFFMEVMGGESAAIIPVDNSGKTPAVSGYFTKNYKKISLEKFRKLVNSNFKK
jgi:hypothetical protein